MGVKASTSGLLAGLVGFALSTSAWTGIHGLPYRQPATVTSSTVSLGAGFYGVNYDYEGAAEFKADNVSGLLHQLDPGTLRWPGGTGADFFDWRTGRPTRNAKSYSFTLAELEKAYKATGATPVFDLNVLAPGNRTNTSNQLQMLERAQSLGIPIKYVEIGNELYGGGSGGAFQAAYPSGTAYGRTVALYVKALHARFKGVQVAADGCLHPSTPRQRRWNAEMLAAATGSGAPDAVIFHDYPGAVYKPFTSADVPFLLEGPYAALGQLDQAARSVNGKPLWITEYNFRGPYVPRKQRQPNPVTTTYAHELYLAELGLLLPRVEHVARVDNWTALDGSAFGAWINPADPKLSPDGQAIEMIDAAGQGAASSAPISIANAPTLPDGEPAITGQAFFGPGRPTTSVLVNLTGHGQSVPVTADIPRRATYQRATGDPTQKRLVAQPLTTGRITSTHLWLPRYSVTLVNTTVSQSGASAYIGHGMKIEH